MQQDIESCNSLSRLSQTIGASCHSSSCMSCRELGVSLPAAVITHATHLGDVSWVRWMSR